ncbi:dolichyl-P-Man:Man(5)GlcNAc(2)-PP-dolichol alpha-1,3-mannosyltransferase [Pyricularia oryzae]|nr:dolichyl-P-Man:Man(5)GlcNAc(2)-PP-dolichol alpha-1,3-mannosyltransferase [Pyricularia oryzae]KAI6400713.1 dolichyl-P-Man:Man(5)GlcNAc(2)-PP-dolichol alpha-1,3-mannosyltransferase [Pyricularia oryzae]KAI6422672.1 dolichyl-P-Man:Man(5)GlcNAc(2)-PP-dolichol alpha-1,3-mannosyltransferase [Pyricularia oryzae]
MAAERPSTPGKPVQFVFDVANGRHPLSRAIPPLLLAFDGLLCGLIIKKVPYTEIDWTTYMQQIKQYVTGERDYTKITGSTGPLVYPAGHVYIYTGLYHITDEGRNILFAQQLFGALYLLTLYVVIACYRKAKVPPYVLPLLVLSKRLHSIFVLRCFNDCFAVLFFWVAIYCFQRRAWSLGGVFYSFGLGIKMTVLLSLPAVGVILLLGRGFGGALNVASIMGQLQVAIGLPFLSKNAWGYLSRAFELSRQFMFKWTVNWRFVGEETFLSKPFAITLLALHASVLLAFVTKRWLKPTSKSIGGLIAPLLSGRPIFTAEEAQTAARAVTSEYVMTTMLTANIVGMLFARSLHYQFYAYLAWSTPYLLWRSGIHPLLQLGLWALQEWAWNVYPSTPVSSGVVVGVMAITVGAVMVGAKAEFRPQVPVAKKVEAKR